MLPQFISLHLIPWHSPWLCTPSPCPLVNTNYKDYLCQMWCLSLLNPSLPFDKLHSVYPEEKRFRWWEDVFIKLHIHAHHGNKSPTHWQGAHRQWEDQFNDLLTTVIRIRMGWIIDWSSDGWVLCGEALEGNLLWLLAMADPKRCTLFKMGQGRFEIFEVRTSDNSDRH